MKIALVINNAYGIGGTIRSTVNLSRALAKRHDVEVVSVHRVADVPQLSFDPRVKLTWLIDMREDSPTYEGDHKLTRQPCTMFPDTGAAANSSRLPYSALQDERIGGWLRRTEADVVIGTRPDLNGYLARDGHSGYLRIGQEHLSLDAHNATLRRHQNRAVAGLDAFVTVSEADAAQYRAALPDVATHIQCIPNGVPAPAVEPSDHRSKTIVAAGRLVSVKRYDRLVDAFAKVADAHPDWTLRIYGRGPEKPRLRRRIDELGLYDRVLLMGPVSPIETEWAKGAVAAVSSDIESFGMTIVEAMHCGVPVVATDCPHGPGEIITHGETGLLVPLDGGIDAYADALASLMSDGAARERLGRAAREHALSYAPAAIARRYEELCHDLYRKRYREQAREGTGRAAARARRFPLLGRLRSALRGRAALAAPGAGPATAGSAAAGSEAVASASGTADSPTAYARSTEEGGIVVRLDAKTLPGGQLDFVARLRRDSKKREIRVPIPLVATAANLGDIRVALSPAVHALAEGRWDCYVVTRGSDTRFRLRSGLTERARLVGRFPLHTGDSDTEGAEVSAWLPYATADGFLALRTWQRPAHAEVERVLVGECWATVTARLLGEGAGTPFDGACVVAVSREAEAHDFTAPIARLPDGRFEFTIPYLSALARRTVEHDLWDLRLRRTATAAPVPLGRIGGDIVDRKKTNVFPPVHLAHPERGATRVKPFFTTTNDLALSARDTEDHQE
ncbi:glycosyltransferase family 4 protein [Streptomyces sp. 2A115]|uniref:glycosyltransferase family 4 protein n=1 Tax=Streptomyces sp. 2A115 TaxID=3457439 RepID=UPI003FCFED8D